MVESTENKANEQYESLKKLATELHLKKALENSKGSRKIVVFVGAGPSRAAGLPLGEDLKKNIYMNFVGSDIKAQEIFDAEYKSYEGSDFEGIDLDKLGLFDIAAIVSRISYGKNVIKDTIKNELKDASQRPLSYELLSHFAKHGYLDHFIILNYDRLLCDALKDEIYESDLKIIRFPEDIPPRDKASDNICYAVYPFGLLSEASRYSLTKEDVAEFGNESMRDFIKNKLFDSSSSNSEPVTLILIGYKGKEPAFEKLLRNLSSKNEDREINVFVINPNMSDMGKLYELESNGVIKPITKINLDADLALELLFELLRNEWGKKNRHSWVSAARHRILSKLFNCAKMPNKERFTIELLLQGVKSRGFVHLETFGRIPRLVRYSDNESAQAINDLIDEKLLKPDKWLFACATAEKNQKNNFYVPNYTIKNTKAVVDKFLQLSKRTNKKFKKWYLDPKNNSFVCVETTSLNFLKSEILKIQTAPDIEIVKDVDPEVKWVLCKDKIHAEVMPSIDTLKRKTEDIIRTMVLERDNNSPVIIRGIWSTGEWLFWKDGWAKELGDRLLESDNVTFKILITKAGGQTIVRSKRRNSVIKQLKKHKENGYGAQLDVRWINWWEMNRIITIVSCDEKNRAIHMRRRLNNPLVCPYYIPSEAINALAYLNELWELYWLRGVAIPGF